MKYRRALWLPTTLLLAMLLLPAGPEASGSIQWFGYKRGIELGQKENKKIFLHFWAESCGYCQKMEKETFTDSAVIAYLNKNFISIKVNADQERTLVTEYNVRGLPDNLFITEKNDLIGNQPGFLPPKALLPLLRYIATDSYRKMPYNKFLDTN